MKTINKIKNGTLINTYTNQVVCVSNFIEFIDRFDNKIIIDIKNNHIYIRSNYKIEYTKKEILFQTRRKFD